MILNQTNINNAVIQASCCMATKATKYYNGLAAGKDNMCLFKEVQLLQKYIDILQCFEIVGSTTTCECNIVGEYIANAVPYQFLSNGTLSYFNPSVNNCNWNYSSNILYISEDEYNYPSVLINNVEPFPSGTTDVLVEGVSIVNGGLVPTPSTLEELVSSFNDQNTADYTVTLIGESSLLFTGPQSDSGLNFQLITTEMPISTPLSRGTVTQEVTFNANCDIILDNFSLPWLYSAVLTITNDDYPELPITINIYNNLSVLQDSIEIPPGYTPEQIVDLFNLYNEAISSGLSMEFTSPNIYTVTSSSLFLSYENWSVEWLQYESLSPPPPIEYVANFEGLEELTLTNQNSCTPEVIKQTCLTNKQVTNIIKNINKICKIC